MLQTAASCSIVGCVLASNAARLDVLIFARLLAGVSIGIFATVTPMYAAECAETATRCTVMSLPQLGMSSGIASAYLASILMLLGGGRTSTIDSYSSTWLTNGSVCPCTSSNQTRMNDRCQHTQVLSKYRSVKYTLRCRRSTLPMVERG